MKRDWQVVREILTRIEADELGEFVRSGGYKDMPLALSDADFLGHIEIMEEAGIIKNCAVRRDASGKFTGYSLEGVYITMQGHDLLDALRDKAVWSRVKQSAKQAGVSLSWEFIKAAVPLIIKKAAEAVL